MTHARTLIRQKIADVLQATFPSVTIDKNRLYVYQSAPNITVKTVSEEINFEESSRSGNRTHYARELEVQLDVVCASSTNLDTLLDDYGEQIESAMSSNFKLDGLCNFLHLIKTEMEFESDEKPDVPLARMVLTYKVFYVTTSTDPS